MSAIDLDVSRERPTTDRPEEPGPTVTERLAGSIRPEGTSAAAESRRRRPSSGLSEATLFFAYRNTPPAREAD